MVCTRNRRWPTNRKWNQRLIASMCPENRFRYRNPLFSSSLYLSSSPSLLFLSLSISLSSLSLISTSCLSASLSRPYPSFSIPSSPYLPSPALSFSPSLSLSLLPPSHPPSLSGSEGVKLQQAAPPRILQDWEQLGPGDAGLTGAAPPTCWSPPPGDAELEEEERMLLYICLPCQSQRRETWIGSDPCYSKPVVTSPLFPFFPSFIFIFWCSDWLIRCGAGWQQLATVLLLFYSFLKLVSTAVLYWNKREHSALKLQQYGAEAAASGSDGRQNLHPQHCSSFSLTSSAPAVHRSIVYTHDELLFSHKAAFYFLI